MHSLGHQSHANRYRHYMMVQQPPLCVGAYGSSRLSTWVTVRDEKITSIVVATHLAPYRRDHKVPGVVAVIDQAAHCISISCAFERMLRYVRQRGFRHLHPRSIQILLQSAVQFHQSAIFKVGHALLLGPAIADGTKFVGRHLVGLFVGWSDPKSRRDEKG